MDKIKNLLISHYGTIPRLTLMWSHFAILNFCFVYLGIVGAYILLSLLGQLYPENSLIVAGTGYLGGIENYVFTSSKQYLILVFLSILVLPIFIWNLLIDTHEILSVFLNNVANGVENLDVEGKRESDEIIANISYFKDFVYTRSPLFNPLSIPLVLRLQPRRTRHLKSNRLVKEALEKRMQFIVDKLDEFIPIIFLGKDKKKLEQIADDLKKYSKIIKEENYLELDEADMRRHYPFIDIFDIKTLSTGIILTAIAWLLR